MTAWKNDSPNNKVFIKPDYLLPSKNSEFEIGSVRYDPVKLAFNPFGASVVILTEVYNIAVGNFSDGYEVSHSLNSGCVTFGSGENSSTIFSKVGIQDTAK